MITNLLCAAHSGVVQEERWAPYDYKFPYLLKVLRIFFY